MSYLDNSGLTYLWSKLKTIFVRASVATVTLSASSWTLSGSYYIQSVTVTGVTAGNNVIVESSTSDVEAYSQSSNSLSFRSLIKPQSNITVKIFIFT